MKNCGCGGDNSITPPEQKLINSVKSIPVKFVQEKEKSLEKIPVIDAETHDILLNDLMNCAGWG